MKKKINQLTVIDPIAIVKTMEKSMPVWVKDLNNKEDMANAIFATSQEMLLVVMDTLRRYHKFEEKDLKQFTKEIEDVLQGVKEFEAHGLNILTPHSVGVIGDKVQESGIAGLLGEIAETRLVKEKMTRAGLEYPISLQATPFIKKLKEKNQ